MEIEINLFSIQYNGCDVKKHLPITIRLEGFQN